MGDVTPLYASVQDASEMLRAIAVLAWPAVALTALLIFRTELSALLSRVTKGKAGPIEFEANRALDQLKATTDAATHALPPTGDDEEASEETAEARARVVDDALQSPKLALIELSAEIERRSREVVASMGHIEDANAPWVRTLNRLDLSPSLKNAARQFRDVRNRLVHGKDTGEDEIVRALDIGFTLLAAINRVPHEVHYVREPIVDLFADADGKIPRRFRGVMLESQHTNQDPFIRVFPTLRHDYRKGVAVAWEFGDRVYPEYWYRDPASGEIQYGQTSALEFTGRPLDVL